MSVDLQHSKIADQIIGIFFIFILSSFALILHQKKCCYLKVLFKRDLLSCSCTGRLALIFYFVKNNHDAFSFIRIQLPLCCTSQILWARYCSYANFEVHLFTDSNTRTFIFLFCTKAFSRERFVLKFKVSIGRFWVQYNQWRYFLKKIQTKSIIQKQM